MKKHVQTDSEWQEEMSQKIIDEIQCELYLDMPFITPWQLTEHIYITIPSGLLIYLRKTACI